MTRDELRIRRMAQQARKAADRLAWLTRFGVRNPDRVAERCERLPAGHWHCIHGHLADCPDPASCGLVDKP